MLTGDEEGDRMQSLKQTDVKFFCGLFHRITFLLVFTGK